MTSQTHSLNSWTAIIKNCTSTEIHNRKAYVSLSKRQIDNKKVSIPLIQHPPLFLDLFLLIWEQRQHIKSIDLGSEARKTHHYLSVPSEFSWRSTRQWKKHEFVGVEILNPIFPGGVERRRKSASHFPQL